MRDFLPRRDADLLNWAEVFSLALGTSPGPEGFGVSAAEASAYAGVLSAYREAYERAVAPGTRGPASVLAKNQSRAGLVRMSRVLAGVVRSHPGLSGSDLVKLGVRAGRLGQGRRPEVAGPKAAPQIQLKRGSGWDVRVRLSDLSTTGRKRPTGVYGALLFYWVGDRLPSGMSDWALGLSTKSMAFGWTLPGHFGGAAVQPGARVWLTACWLSPTLEQGPLCQPIAVMRGFDAGPVVRRLGMAA